MIVAHFQTATEYVALHALTLEPFVRLTIFFPPHDLWSLSFSRDRSVENTLIFFFFLVFYFFIIFFLSKKKKKKFFFFFFFFLKIKTDTDNFR